MRIWRAGKGCKDNSAGIIPHRGAFWGLLGLFRYSLCGLLFRRRTGHMDSVLEHQVCTFLRTRVAAHIEVGVCIRMPEVRARPQMRSCVRLPIIWEFRENSAGLHSSPSCRCNILRAAPVRNLRTSSCKLESTAAN